MVFVTVVINNPFSTQQNEINKCHIGNLRDRFLVYMGYYVPYFLFFSESEKMGTTSRNIGK